jgi:hypothetical protein
MNCRYGENNDDPNHVIEGNGMFVRFEEIGTDKLTVPDLADGKWSPRRTLLFIVVASLLGWSAILSLLYLLYMALG